MLQEIVKNKRFRLKAVVGFWPANSVGDDVVLYKTRRMGGAPARRPRKSMSQTIRFLRQQKEKVPTEKTEEMGPTCAKKGNPLTGCLADYVRPLSTGRTDYLGGSRNLRFRSRGVRKTFFGEPEDYSSIWSRRSEIVCAGNPSRNHSQTNEDQWGFGRKGKFLALDDLIAEKYRGISPAPGYPACPDDTEKAPPMGIAQRGELNTGNSLTENFAMNPPSSVSGFYFGHPMPSTFTSEISAETRSPTTP